MYAGTTLTKISGRFIGAHQKIDRVARKHLTKLLTEDNLFPNARSILQFEGKNGPDAIKRKSPGYDEPWHFYSPFDEEDSELLGIITNHFNRLVQELIAKNVERSAFEAAWLAHAIVDGLTPAHHYPYEEKLVELRGDTIESRNTIMEKLVVSGDNRREKFKNNWKLWGPKGLMTTHSLFEFGVATLIAPLSMSDAAPTPHDVDLLNEVGVIEKFKQTAKEIAILDMYSQYYKKGWTPKLAYTVRNKLAPTIVRMVTLAWYAAMEEAKLTK